MINGILNFLIKYRLDVCTTSYLQKNEKLKHKNINQWPTFSAGNSFLKAKVIDKIKFDMAFEFGYGEDSDFGAQLRQAGFDIVYNPNINIKHLKAPMGGFRSRFKQIWDHEIIQPKPAPTVLLSYIKNKTVYQLNGYKTILFFKFFLKQSIRNPYSYIKLMQKKWKLSVQYANKLEI